ncbi:MAG TPA: VWA domain-containing protein [Vicinamibacterales bacterium]|nr:VWA domain-containing protein [Vicinamibacterales bacterium]
MATPRRKSVLAVAAAAALASAGGATVLLRAQQQPVPNFSAGTKTVAVYATVTDDRGRLMPDLLSGDFEVMDNGKRQPITVFSNDNQPITVVMLVDRSRGMVSSYSLTQKAAESFVAAMAPADKARIGSFSNRIEVDPEEFTSDHDQLLDILHNNMQDAGPTPLWNAVNVGITALDHQEGRRVILIFSDGADNPMNGRNNNTSLSDVMKRADEENVMVYAVGVGSATPPRDYGGRGGGRGFGGPRGGFGRRPGGFSSTGAAFEAQRGGSSRESGGKPNPDLAKLAGSTGGGYFELQSTDDLDPTFQRVADELHHQYAIGFVPPNLDGKTHAIDLHVQLSGTTVRARKSYIASKQ